METSKKVATGQLDDYTTGCLLDQTYFEYYYKMIAIDNRCWSKSNSLNKFYGKLR